MKLLLTLELLKLKRSQLIILSIIGAFTPSMLILVGLVKANYIDHIANYSFSMVFREGNLYSTLLFFPIIYSLIGGYLFSQEYTQNTLKTIFTMPISKSKFILSKFIIYILWSVFLCIFSWIGITFASLIGGADHFSVNVLIDSLSKYLLAGSLLSIALMPIMYLSMKSKSIYLPMLVAASICLINIFLSNEDFAIFFPYSSAYIITSSNELFTTLNEFIGLGIIIIVGLFGSIMTMLSFQSNDLIN